MRRRVRIYSYGKATSPEARQALARQARREFQILEGVESPGILKVLDYKETELGPALVFEHDPGAQRLDHYLQRKLEGLDIGRRLFIVRELAETLRHAHKKRLFHRALTPASVLIREKRGAGAPVRLRIMNWQTAAREPSGTGTIGHTTGTHHVEDYVEDPGRVYLAPEALHTASPAGHRSTCSRSVRSPTWCLRASRPPTIRSRSPKSSGAGQACGSPTSLDGAAKGLQDLVQ